MIRKITEKHMSIIMLIIFLLSLVPILGLALYNYPGADDFSASHTLYHAWLETGSVAAVLGKALEYVKYTYFQWSGLFMSMFWTALQPGIFGEQFYGATTFISIILLVTGGFYLTHVCVVKYLNGNKYQANILSCIYLLLMIQCMPDGNEGLYWHAGVVNYTWAFAFLLMLTGVTLSLIKENNSKKRVIKTIFSFVLAVFVGGGNFITALQGCIWMAVIAGLFILFRTKQKGQRIGTVLKQNKAVFVPMVTIIISFGISVLAPGNQVRIATAGEGMGAVRAIMMSFVYCLKMPFTEWISLPVVLLLALAIPFMWKVVENSKLKFGYPLLAAVPGYGIASAAYTPNLYAQGSMVAGRVQDTAYFILITIVYAVMFYVIGWIQKRFKAEKNSGNVFTGKTLVYIIGLCILLAGTFLVDTVREGENYISSEAVICLISGQAKSYRQENQVRLDMLYNSDEENIVFDGFSNPPELLHFQDVTFDEEDWINKAVARYYRKTSVKRMK